MKCLLSPSVVLSMLVSATACTPSSTPAAAPPSGAPQAAASPGAPPAPGSTPALSAAATSAVASGPASAHLFPAEPLVVTAKNTLNVARSGQTVVVKLDAVKRLARSLDPARALVFDAQGKPVDSQIADMDGDYEPDELVFQSDFQAGETKQFSLRAGPKRERTREQYKVYGRFARERHEDFVWENDRIARRAYGAALETWAKEPLTSSGLDVWVKRTKKLVVNDWYMMDDYHEDRGEGADMYSVGKTRGCGGVGVWAGDRLHTSRNFTGSRVLANGPVRLVFELSYPAWDAGGVKVTETKRVILDAGKNLERYESTFKAQGAAKPLQIGIGIAKHDGAAQFEKEQNILRSWEPLKKSGNIGCAVVLPKGATAEQKTTDVDFLLVTPAPAAGPLVYYTGFGWDRSGDFANEAAWAEYVRAFARDAAAPLEVAVAAEPSAQGWTARKADSIMRERPQVLTEKWDYDTGLVLKGFEQLWLDTKDRKYFDYVKRTIDGIVQPDGTIRGYRLEDYNIDMVNMGKVIFHLLAQTNDPKEKERYTKALQTLRSQMKTHPRTSERAFWHKKIYPSQMWLDGVFMASPFLAEYAVVFKEPALFDDVANQIVLAEKYMRDAKTGLLYHGWDESRKMPWANPKTGTSPAFWGRAMGWYAMGIVDVLEHLPKNHPRRPALLAVLQRLATAIVSVQDRHTGTWWQVLDQPARAKNYLEASASSMFTYALFKGVRNGWLEPKFMAPALKGYRGILERFVTVDPSGRVDLNHVCKVAGLGGTPYRDGTYDYYVSTEVVSNDPKGVGAFLLAGLEFQRAR